MRQADHSDIAFIMEVGRRFANEAGVTAEVGWDDDSVRGLLGMLIDNEDGILLVGKASIFGGLVFAHPFNNVVRVFQELFWRSEGIEGLRLLREGERLAKARGASRFLMLDIATMPDLERLYTRQGYRLAERTFIKEL